LALKRYPTIKNNVTNRIVAETEACNFLSNQGVEKIPSLVTSNKDLNIALYSWIEGMPTGTTDLDDIEQAIAFVKHLKLLSQSSEANLLPIAGEACLSRQILVDQISKRILKLRESRDTFGLLSKFLRSELEPAWEQLFMWQKSTFADSQFDEILIRKHQTLSPSDFGFHNSLRMPDNRINWIDFEYFGWDDPVKLVLDFIWHPAMTLNENQKYRWIEECANFFSGDPLFYQRLRLGYPLYGMRWALILLNEFLVDGWDVRSKAQSIDPFMKRDRLINQLEKSRKILNYICLSEHEIFDGG
jgi:hypothetical protein